jgi:hypothetical protein
VDAEIGNWYNTEQCPSGIGYLHPGDLHNGTASKISDARQKILDAAYQAYPERFMNGPPVHRLLRGSRRQPSYQKTKINLQHPLDSFRSRLTTHTNVKRTRKVGTAWVGSKRRSVTWWGTNPDT